MTINLDELERLARAALEDERQEQSAIENGVPLAGRVSFGMSKALFNLLSETTPAAVLELIKRLRAAEQDVARLDDAITKYKEQSCDSK